MHFSVYDSIYPRLNLESSRLLSCDLDVSIQILGWIVWINYFDTPHTTVFDQFDCLSIGLMHYHQWSKRSCSVRLASYT